MSKGYFDKKAEENKATFLKMCIAVVQGLIRITTIRIDKTLIGKEHRAVIFFERKDDK